MLCSRDAVKKGQGMDSVPHPAASQGQEWCGQRPGGWSVCLAGHRGESSQVLESDRPRFKSCLATCFLGLSFLI